MSYLKIENVTKDYGTFVALRGITLNVQEGEFVSLLGPSGCGKTSLLRSVAGLEDIQGGTISVGERLFSKKGYTMPPESRHVGLIFQSYALWPHMTVFKNIAYSLKLHGWKRADIKRRVTEVLEIVGLEGLESRLPAQLSGGQMQRVAVARSIAATPALLLFDEPLSNLDAKLRESMRFELRRIQREVGTTAVYVTHDQSEAMVISDRIVLMNQGEIVQDGTAQDLYERPETAFAAKFLGFSNFLPARVEDVSRADGLATFRLDLPGCGIVTGSSREGLKRGDLVDLSIRPESVRVVDRGSGADSDTSRWSVRLPASVADMVYAGNVCDVFLDFSGTRIRVQVTPADYARLNIGGGVDMVFEPQSVWPVPRDTTGDVVDESEVDGEPSLEPVVKGLTPTA
jgi:iron(III) transport system ATP-binding protein